MAQHYGPNIVTDGLVLCLDAADKVSYPGSGTTWYDLVGTSDLTNSGATWNAGGYFTFDGDGDNLETQSANLTFSSAITMCQWWKRTGAGTGSPRTLEMMLTGATGAYSHCLAVDGDASLRCWWDENTTASDRFLGLDDATTWTDGNWHYMVSTYDDPTGILYMDSNLVETGTQSTTGLDNVNIITVGAITDYGGTYTHSEHAFQGDIAITMVYNRALSAKEVSQNFNAQRSRFSV